MHINQRLVEQLQQFTSQGSSPVEAEADYTLGLKGDGPSVTVILADYDRYSIALKQLGVQDPRLSAADFDLSRCAEQIVARLNYLEEPLALVELDPDPQTALIRSQPPHQTDETITYWEATLQRYPTPQIQLTRYQWSPSQPERETLPYPLTFGSIGRIAADLAGSLIVA